MAEDTCIFIRGHCTRDQVAELVGRVIGHALVRVAGVDWPVDHTLTVGLDVRVYDQDGLVDDLGIPFSRYDYVVDLEDERGVVEEEYRREWRQMFAIVLASVIARLLDCECIVVDQMQHLLESFPHHHAP